MDWPLNIYASLALVAVLWVWINLVMFFAGAQWQRARDKESRSDRAARELLDDLLKK